MATIKRFEDIEAWRLARDMSKDFGLLIQRGRFQKNFRLINQVQGSLGSIMDNIAEGFERGSRSELVLFLGYSKGSCGEFRSQLYRSLDQSYLTQEEFENFYQQSIRISVALYRFIKYLLNSTIPGIRKLKDESISQ